MHTAKYAFYGVHDIVSGGIDEDEDEDDGGVIAQGAAAQTQGAVAQTQMHGGQGRPKKKQRKKKQHTASGNRRIGVSGEKDSDYQATWDEGPFAPEGYELVESCPPVDTG